MSCSLICSQLVATAYATAGVILVDKPTWAVTPGDLLDHIRHQPVPEDR